MAALLIFMERMMSQNTLDEFLSRNRINLEQWEASNLKWRDLEEIGIDYEKNIPHLEATSTLLANIIQRFHAVHSVRWRVKDKNHLLSKIIRKCADRNEKYIGISKYNYSEIVTDLIGLRALHLFKDDFSSIDESVKNSFELKDDPVVYIREGDDAQFNQRCVDNGFKVEAHPKGYRSIHYVITTQPLKKRIYVELQVRTIFEEGWSEIDHIVRYPNYSDNARLGYLLTMFNRMAGSADEMGGFVRNLADDLNEIENTLANLAREKNESIAKVEDLVKQLAAVKGGEAGDEKVSELQSELQNLKATPSDARSARTTDAWLKRLAMVSWTGDASARISEAMDRIEVSERTRNPWGGYEGFGKIQEALDGIDGHKKIQEALDGIDGHKKIQEALDGIDGHKKIQEALDGIDGHKKIQEALDGIDGHKKIQEALDKIGGQVKVQEALKQIEESKRRKK